MARKPFLYVQDYFWQKNFFSALFVKLWTIKKDKSKTSAWIQLSFILFA